MFDPECIKQVNRILSETGAKLVVSSSWRSMSDLPEIFAGVGLPTKFDITPWANEIFNLTLSDNLLDDVDDIRWWRGSEIKWWLEHNTPDANYVILDDDPDMLEEQQKHFIRTSTDLGLTPRLANKAIEILNKN